MTGTKHAAFCGLHLPFSGLLLDIPLTRRYLCGKKDTGGIVMNDKDGGSRTHHMQKETVQTELDDPGAKRFRSAARAVNRPGPLQA